MKTTDFQKSANYAFLLSARDSLEHAVPNKDDGINFEDWLSAKNLLDKMIWHLSEVIPFEE